MNPTILRVISIFGCAYCIWKLLLDGRRAWLIGIFRISFNWQNIKIAKSRMAFASLRLCVFFSLFLLSVAVWLLPIARKLKYVSRFPNGMLLFICSMHIYCVEITPNTSISCEPCGASMWLHFYETKRRGSSNDSAQQKKETSLHVNIHQFRWVAFFLIRHVPNPTTASIKILTTPSRVMWKNCSFSSCRWISSQFFLLRVHLAFVCLHHSLACAVALIRFDVF